MKIKDLVKCLETLAPLKLAESWDNVGLLLEPTFNSDIKKVLTTIDLTEPVVDEAINKGCNFVLSYHPPLFQSFKRLLQSNAKDRIVMKCVQNNISIYSPHTCWDSMENGVNDWIGSCFDCKDSRAINQHDASSEIVGMGRVLQLSSSIPLDSVYTLLRNHLGVEHLRVAHAVADRWTLRNNQPYEKINTIAICAGSGGSLLRGVDADLYITGEMSHHEVLAVVAEGRSVILSEHTHTERGFLKHVVKDLSKSTSCDLEFLVSEADCCPLNYV